MMVKKFVLGLMALVLVASQGVNPALITAEATTTNATPEEGIEYTQGTNDATQGTADATQGTADATQGTADATQGTKDYIIGDLNFDGKVTDVDVAVLRDYIIGVKYLSDVQKQVVDVAYDQEVNVRDLITLKRIVYNKEGTGTITLSTLDVDGSEELNADTTMLFDEHNGLDVFITNPTLDTAALADEESIAMDTRKSLGGRLVSMVADFNNNGTNKGTVRDDSGTPSHTLQVLDTGETQTVKFKGYEGVGSSIKIEVHPNVLAINDAGVATVSSVRTLTDVLVRSANEMCVVDDVSVRLTSLDRICIKDLTLGEMSTVEGIANDISCCFANQYLKIKRDTRTNNITVNGVQCPINYNFNGDEASATLGELDDFSILHLVDAEGSDVLAFFNDDSGEIYELNLGTDFTVQSVRIFSISSKNLIKCITVDKVADGVLSTSAMYYNYDYKLSKFYAEDEYNLGVVHAKQYGYFGTYDFDNQKLISRGSSNAIDDYDYVLTTTLGEDTVTRVLENQTTGIQEFSVTWDNSLENTVSIDASMQYTDDSIMTLTYVNNETTARYSQSINDYATDYVYDKSTESGILRSSKGSQLLYNAVLNYDYMVKHDYTKCYT